MESIAEYADTTAVVLALLAIGATWLLIKRISDSLTAHLVRKDELLKSFNDFKIELLKELVSSKDLQIFKLEQATSFEIAMKENRHAVAHTVQEGINVMTKHTEELIAQIQELKVAVAVVIDHSK